MEQKTIGGFLSALRKANGLTQQDVAERLNVSNKTVSKWERDISSPFLSLIPAIAELYGVTCDEILLGKRLSVEASSEEPVRQREHLASRAVVKFKNAACISLLLTVLGLIFLFSVSYGFYAPVIGVGVCLVFVAVAVVFAAIQLNTAKYSLGSQGEADLIASSRATIHQSFFTILAVNIIAFCLAMPFVLVRDSNYVRSVINFESYIILLPLVLAVSSLLILGAYTVLRFSLSLPARKGWVSYRVENGWKLNLVQGGFTLAALLSPLPVLITDKDYIHPNIELALFTVLALCSLIGVVYCVAKGSSKTQRYLLAATGLRNFLFGVSATIALNGIVRSTYAGAVYYEYNFLYSWQAFCIVLAAVIAYLIFKYAVVSRYKRASMKH